MGVEVRDRCGGEGVGVEVRDRCGGEGVGVGVRVQVWGCGCWCEGVRGRYIIRSVC